MKKLKIGFIGNFAVPYTTEAHRSKSFEKLGHEVIRLQENETTVAALRQQLEFNAWDILFYSHTHGYEIKGLADFFAECKNDGVPTVSVHLDRWLWLDREKDMGKEATWKTEYIFMADGSPEAAEKYNQLGLNWYYLKPGVFEDDCYMAEPNPAQFPHDIIFVGSRGYHKEYRFRPMLIDFLQRAYGERFGHYGNDGLGVVRGHDLNVLYATAKIAVGDSCFGGRPNYWSDRVPETVGRGGFLLHPITDGLYIPHGAYVSGSLNDLKRQIDYYLVEDKERERIKNLGFEWVKKYETYTHRAREMLNIIFGDNNGT